MRPMSSSGLRSSHCAVALVLVCCACSSGSSDSATVPGSTTPVFNPLPPGSGVSGAPEGPADGSPDPGAAGSTATDTPALTPEVPIAPTLMQPESSEEDTMSGDGEADPSPEASGDGSAPAQPSTLCGSGGATPSFDIPNTLFSVPPSYDGTTPLPVVIAFHAAGNQNTQLRGILGNTLDDDYIVFYPKSAGNGWSNGADAAKVDAIFAALDATACYDEGKVFATGHSSGAQFIVQRLCAGETRWRAVAPVASSVYCSSWAAIPALVIHGIGDVEREAYGLDDGEGLKDIVPYRTSNGCQATFTEVPVDGCSSGGVQVNPGCRDFDGCGERTRWCQHNDPQYGTSHHGVPCFGARVIKDFFDSYR
jgi:polyhydroxybutyrate depolymerase